MKYIVPTIDVEAIRKLDQLGHLDTLILGKVNEGVFGIEKIIETLKKYKGTATFFVDYAEIGHGIGALQKITEIIETAGCEAGLHIHPQFIANSNRYLLNQYSYYEQAEIFKQCIANFKQCSTCEIVSFRAGGYGANDDSLKILAANQIRVDSSYYKNHKWCKISPKKTNVVSHEMDLIHFPITLFQHVKTIALFTVPLLHKRSTKKVDIDHISIPEIDQLLQQYKTQDSAVIDLFMHSYSLLKWSADYTHFSANFENLHKLDYFLQQASQYGFKIASIKDFLPDVNHFLNQEPFVPTVLTRQSLLKSILKTIKIYYRRFRR